MQNKYSLYVDVTFRTRSFVFACTGTMHPATVYDSFLNSPGMGFGVLSPGVVRSVPPVIKRVVVWDSRVFTPPRRGFDNRGGGGWQWSLSDILNATFNSNKLQPMAMG